MKLKQSLTIAILLSIVAIAAWEIYWKSQGEIPELDDDKNLWVTQRTLVENATANDVLLMGSSRVLFDIQLPEWEAQTGKKPIQLATAGASPIPIFRDIVNNTDFKGTILVGVTPGLFFSTTFPEAPPFERAQSRVDYFKDRTYAQQLNYWLSLPLEKNLAFISTTEEGWATDIDLKALLKNVKIGNRKTTPGFPPFNNFGIISDERNMKMTERTTNDTAYANTVKAFWKAIIRSDNPPPEREKTTAFFVEDAKRFKARGGNLVLVYCPSTGMFKDGETNFFKRTEFWDVLLEESGGTGYHYLDYDQLKDLDCPEWSHLSAEDAQYFTTELVKLMKRDGNLPNSKTN